MAKKSPSLQLVEKRSLPEGRAGFEVASFSDLSASEQKRVERLMQQINPEAGIAGVAILPRAWDLRPIVVLPSEPERSPSVVRFLGPEVTLSLSLSSRVSDVLKRLVSLNDPASRLLQWGQLEGQIWYRRTLMTTMLNDRLVEPEPLSFTDALSIATRLVSTIEAWHSRGIIHGHIASSNIALGADGSVYVLDAGIGLAMVQANTALGVDEFPKGYSPQTFAREAAQSEFVSPAMDIFGLGRVFWEVFGRVPRAEFSQNKMSGADFKVIRELVLAMADDDASVRPALDVVKHTLEGKIGRGRTAAKIARPDDRPERRVDAPLRPTQELTPAEIPVRSLAAPPPAAPLRPTQEWSPAELPVREIAHTAEAPAALKQGESLTGAAESAAADFFERPRTPGRRTPIEDFVPEPPQAVNESLSQELYGFEELAPSYDETEATADLPESREAIDQDTAPGGRSTSHLYFIAAGVLLLIFGIYYYLHDEAVQLSDDELRTAWESGMPSQMQQVALAAVRKPVQNQTAAALIVKSALGSDKPNTLINAPLLRVAFDRRWEAELSPTDRRVALTLATLPLLKNKVPTEQFDFPQLHPGVILAILASLPRPEAVAKIPGLSDLSAASLRRLPPPMNFTFEQLLHFRPDTKCGDAVVLALVHFATRGLQGVDEVAQFLEEDTGLRLATLAALFSTDESSARQLLEWVTKHQNFRVEHELIKWGRQVNLASWPGLSSNDKLFLLAGIPLKGVTSPELVVQMLGHPSATVRQAALQKTIDLVPLQHRGALKVLAELKEQPQLLTPLQTLQLALFLIRPEVARSREVREWLKTPLPQKFLQTLLLESADGDRPTAFDLEVALFLQRANWEPELDELSRLSHHPVRFVRLFAYSKIFRLSDREAALKMFRAAEKRERDEELKRQLDLNMSFLSLE